MKIIKRKIIKSVTCISLFTLCLTGCSLKKENTDNIDNIDQIQDIIDLSNQIEYDDNIIPSESLGDVIKIDVMTDSNESYTGSLTVLEVVRGDEAQLIVDEYNDNTSNEYRIEPLKNSNLEYAVITYTLELNDDFPDETEISTKIPCEIIGLTGDSIKYNGEVYTGGQTIYIESDDSIATKEIKGIGRIIYTVPTGCTDYLVKFGTLSLGYFRE